MKDVGKKSPTFNLTFKQAFCVFELCLRLRVEEGDSPGARTALHIPID